MVRLSAKHKADPEERQVDQTPYLANNEKYDRRDNEA